jgi:signal transduction histidine kinase/CheY-like chemotaxis protein/HPt (histidine-containing phosphotransfer) domain-containing protein
MTSRKKINIGVLFPGFAMISVVFVLTGIMAYSTMVRYSKEIMQESISDRQLFLLNGLVTDLQGAEFSVQSYRLGRDSTYLETFYFHSIGSVEKLALLDSIFIDTGHYDELTGNLVDLVRDKLQTLESLAGIEDRMVVVGVVDRIRGRVGSLEPSGQRRDFLRNLFSRERVATANSDPLMQSLESEVANVKKEQAKRLADIDHEELAHLMKIYQLSKEIDMQISEIRSAVLDRLGTEHQLVQQKQLQVNRNIRLFSVAALLLLVMGSISIAGHLLRRKQLIMALKEAKASAEEYSRMQERFAANMTHEVRTPLHAIAGFTEQLLQDQPPERREEFIRIIHSAVRHLQSITDDILDYSKLREGKMRLMLQPLSPEKEAITVLTLFQENFESKNLSLQFNTSLHSGFQMLGDPLRFRQILINLLSNALKFTCEGGVFLELTLISSNDLKSVLLVEVADTGTGMTAEETERVFLPYEQLANDPAVSHHGTGLGLTITRELIEQQGGNITVKSQPGTGTRVTFTLPVTEETDFGTLNVLHQKPNNHLSSATVPIHDMRILVADDEEWNRRLVEEILIKEGNRPLVVQDGLTALETLLNQPWDLALLDIRMPGKTGVEIVTEIKERHPANNTKFIALTAQGSHGEQKKLVKAGFLHVLIKPFSATDLIAVIQDVGSVLRNDAAPDKENSSLTAPSCHTTQLFDPDGLKHLAHNDSGFVIKMVEIFIRNSRERMQELDDAVKRDRHQEMAEVAHKMMPAVRQMRAKRLEWLLGQLQNSIKTDKSPEGAADIVENIIEATQELIRELMEYYSMNEDQQQQT